MNLSEPFIRRPIMTTLLALAVFIVGMISYKQLSVSNLPDVSYPTINVSVSYPGTNPETMANTVATPLEKEFMTIPGITEVTSTNTLGSTSIILQFDISKSMDAAAQDVEAAISRAQGSLPAGLPSSPTYSKVNPSDTPIMYISLTSSTMPADEMYTYANTYIGQRLSMIEGVAQVQTYGFPYAVRIQVDPTSLATLGLTLADVSRAINSASPSLPAGGFNGKDTAFTISPNGQIPKAEDYNNLIIAYHNGAPIHLKDVGIAIDSTINDKASFRYINMQKGIDQETVVLAIQRQPGANTVKVAEAVKEYLPKLQALLPASVDLFVIFDQSLSIKNSINNVQSTMIEACLLVVLVIFFYLGKIRDTLIPAIVMPMSVIGTFAIMKALGYTLDNLSLLALTLSIGFIIDDAIVVLENIVRLIEEGENPWKAAIEGSKQIGFTILSITISLAAVFIPLIFMGGLIGKIFQEFSITLTVATIISGVISLTLTPMLCSRFLSIRSLHTSGKIAQFSQNINDALLRWYTPKLKWMLAHKKVALLAGSLCLIFSVVLFRTLPTDFIPDDDIGFIIGFNQMEEGTSSHKMVDHQKKVIGALKQDPNIDSFVSIAGFPQYRQGINFLVLKEEGDRLPVGQVIQGLFGRTMPILGVGSFYKNVPLIDLSSGVDSKGAYQYTLVSSDANALYKSGQKLTEMMQTNPIFQGVSNDLEIKSPQINLEILRKQAAVLGVSVEDIEQALLLAYSGNRVSKIQTPIDQYDVILELSPKFQWEPSSLTKNYVRSSINDKLIPLSSLVKATEDVSTASISHNGQFPSMTVSFSLIPGTPLGTGIELIQEMSKESLEGNVSGSLKGSAQSFEDTIKKSGFLLFMSVLAIYIVLGILYESFIHPITILTTLPPATLGGLLTLLVFGLPLSLYAYLGIILLIGIVKKNGIILVDYAIQNIQEQKSTPEKAILDACIVRFRPIMMTTVAAIVGALPIAFGYGAGAASRRPLGMVIIGGLVFSQMITLFLTPVFYLYLEKLNNRFHLKEKKHVGSVGEVSSS